MRYCLLCLSLLLSPLAAFAEDASWQQIKNDARGQTVWFNAWVATTQLTSISTGLAAR